MSAAAAGALTGVAVIATYVAVHPPPPRRVDELRQGRRRPSRPSSPRAMAVGGVAVVVAAALVSPVVGVALAVAAVAVPRVRARRARAATSSRVAADLPEVVDLLAVAVSAGLTVHLAVRAVAGRVDGPLGAGLNYAIAATDVGARLADALDELPARAGDCVRPLVAALTSCERYGAPALSSLERVADEVRRDRQRRVEAAARRLPVQLLFPLVLCILPAFALLTVAPLLAGALGSLRL